MRLLLSILFALLLTPLAHAQEDLSRSVNMQEFDIRNDFCGVHINFQYCKCAFHDEYCGSIGMDQDSANSHVQSEFGTWVEGKRTEFKNSCETNNGRFSADTCRYCDAPNEWKGSSCLAPGQEESKECLDDDEIEDNWAKYSDIDEAIPLSDRSFEAQQFTKVGEELTQKMVEAFEIEHDMELDRQTRLALREYRDAVIDNIQANLLKAFWRLAYVTYSTIQGSKGNGQTYVDVITASEATIPVVANGIGLIQSNIPSGSALEIDTKTDVGKIRSIVAGAELEALKSLGDPVAVATKVVSDVASLPIPSANISEEEVDLLRTQRVLRDALDNALQESYKINALRRKRLIELEQEIETLRAEAQEWESKEKERVQSLLQEDCEADETSWMNWIVPPAYARGSTKALGEYIINYNDVVSKDTTGDGQDDRFSYYEDGALVMTGYDLDANGKEDMWLSYDDDEYLNLEAYDTNGDGEPDDFTYLSRDEQPVSDPVEPDIDFDELESSNELPNWLPYAGGGVILMIIIFLLARPKKQEL